MKMDFESKFFQKIKFDNKTIEKYFRNATKDFKIATKSNEPEVIFNFSFSSLIKIGITLVAVYGYRVRSKTGHHIKILEKLSEILENNDIEIMGNKMRKKRNLDLYDGGIIISSKEASDYLVFTAKIIKKAESYIKSQPCLF